MVDKVVIVGAGHGGVEAACALRQRGFAGSVTLIDAARHLPYQRPPLSKDYLKGDQAEPLLLKAEAIYERSNIDLRLGVSVLSIDRDGRTIDADGETIPYDHLVLALGALNRRLPIPGIDDPGVLELRNLDHSNAIRTALGTMGAVAIIGAGFIGLELAAVLRGVGKDVDVIEMGDRVMGRAVSTAISDHVRAVHEDLGVHFHFGRQVRSIEKDGEVYGLTLDDGTVRHAACVVVAAGVVPNDALAVEAGLDVDGGIVVDEQLLTSDPAISAVGDCVAFPCVFAGARVRLESVQNALDQARTVARRITGDASAYRDLPWFWSNQGPVRLQIAGISTGYDSVVIRQHAPDRLSAFLYAGDRLLAVESVNASGDHMAARRLIDRGIKVPKEVAADPASDLKALLAAPVG